MDQALANFLGWHTLIFALACWILTFFTRRVVETIWPSLAMKADENDPAKSYATTMSRWWNKVILYAVPVVWGGLSAMLAKKYPFPQGIQTLSGRLFFGLVIGFFSGFAFKIVIQMIGRKFNVDVSNSGAPPVAGSLPPAVPPPAPPAGG